MLLARPRRKGEGNIRKNFIEIRREAVDSTELPLDNFQCWRLVNMGRHIWIP
jgi:hypothetical protein